MAIEVPADEARALLEWPQEQAMMMPKEALIASNRALAEALLSHIEGSLEDRAAVLGLAPWGSECTDCGNTTPGSMVCDECGSERHTVMLFWTPPSREEFKAAARAAAFEKEDGRKVIHSTTMPPLMIGADTDLEALLDEIDRARDVQWQPHPIQDDHQLGLITEDGRVRFYDVRRPGAE